MSVNGFFNRYRRSFLMLICGAALIIWGQACAPGTRGGSPSSLLIITSVSSFGMTSVGASVSWSTNKPADSLVEYGLTANYGNQTSIGTLDTNHSVNLFGLTPNTTYHFRVK